MRMILIGLVGLTTILAIGGAISWWLSDQIETRFPPLGEPFRASQADLHYADVGTGPALVLIHGAGANLRDFDANLVTQLKDRFRLIRIDRPGSGYSRARSGRWLNPAEQAAVIGELLDALQVEEAIWIGHSWGGSLVMAALLNDPQRTRGGVMLAGAAYPWEGGVEIHHRLPAWPVLGPMLTHTLIPPIGAAALEGGAKAVFEPNEPIPDYAEKTGLALYLRPSQIAATATDVTSLSEFLELQAPRYGEIGNPMLLVHGVDDDIVPAWNHTDRLEKLLPDVEVLRLEATGHAPHHVHTELIAQRVAAFAGRALGAQP